MKWLVYGCNGWIGGMIKDHLLKINEDVVAGLSRCDDELNVHKEIVTVKPDRVLCLIGRTHGDGFTTIDYLEQKDKLHENIQDNLYAPLVLATICKKYNIHFTYLGTGCIFEYDQSHDGKKFTEDDKPNFFGSSYSVVKGFTDRIMHFTFPEVLNLRIRMPIIGSHHPRNFITKIVGYKKICSIPNSMSVLDDLIPVMIDMISKKISGTINLTNPDVIEHNEILEMYKYYVDPLFIWDNFSVYDQNRILLSKRSNNHLDTSYIETHYPHIKNIKDSIRQLFINWSKS